MQLRRLALSRKSTQQVFHQPFSVRYIYATDTKSPTSYTVRDSSPIWYIGFYRECAWVPTWKGSRMYHVDSYMFIFRYQHVILWKSARMIVSFSKLCWSSYICQHASLPQCPKLDSCQVNCYFIKSKYNTSNGYLFSCFYTPVNRKPALGVNTKYPRCETIGLH